MIEPDFVNGVDGRRGIGIGCQKDAAGVGLEGADFLEKFGTAHHRHTLVGEEKRDAVAARRQLADQRKAFFEVSRRPGYGSP